MSVPYDDPRFDEYDIRFEDTSTFAIQRWEEIVQTCITRLGTDAAEVQKARDWEMAQKVVMEESSRRGLEGPVRSRLMSLQPVPRSWANLTGLFVRDIQPKTVDFNILWGLFILNVTLRRCAERFTRCYANCQARNESAIAFVDFFDRLFQILCDNCRYLRRCATGESPEDRQELTESVLSHVVELDEISKHLTEMSVYSALNMRIQLDNVAARAKIPSDDPFKGKSPIVKIPFDRNPKFFGRKSELAQIDAMLKREEGKSALRTATIYGRRGGGKTDLAQEYAYSNPSQYQLLFWVRCETETTLRQSFTDIAVALNLPGAERIGRHEECQMQVLEFLKNTNATWLLIFDNCERSSELALKGYWPMGCEGAILLTSRDYYNFLKDENRKGITIEPFRSPEDWGLLMNLFDKSWLAERPNGGLSDEETSVLKDWLRTLQGLPLSIRTAATVIQNRTRRGDSILEICNAFTKAANDLPDRQKSQRSDIIQSLDAVFNMSFSTLSRHARDLLKVLALLSPDEILVGLFLPRNQSALDGKLAFAKHTQSDQAAVNGGDDALSNVVIAPDLLAALTELEQASLIRFDGRSLAIHREIQEAMNYLSSTDLQEAFHSCVGLVFEAFPKQKAYNTLYDQWRLCGAYITHVVHLTKKYRIYLGPDADSPLIATREYIELLQNATWYLYDIGDYDTGRKLVDDGVLALKMQNQLRTTQHAKFANIQGCNYYDLNRMDDCRRNWEQALQLQRALKADETLADVATSLSNLGNLESATMHYEEALQYFNDSVAIRTAIGKSAEPQLGNTYLGIGRLFALQKNFSEARRHFNMGERLYLQTKKPERLYMAHYFYAYANCDYEEGLYSAARRGFDSCLESILQDMPIHPLTCAAYFSLGCTFYRMKLNAQALINYGKARRIAELRSPSRDDGTVARILWWTAQILREDVTKDAESGQLLNRAYTARLALIASREAGECETIMLEMDADKPETRLVEDSFDQLVPGLYR